MDLIHRTDKERKKKTGIKIDLEGEIGQTGREAEEDKD